MFLGLDLSLTGTGAVVLKSPCYSILSKDKIVAPEGSVGMERLFILESIFLEYLSRFDITICCIESPSFASEKGQLFQLGEWAGLAKLQLYKKGIPFFFAAPNQLKKYVTGEGKGKKELIILDVYKNFGAEIRDNDIADAYVLARIASDYYNIFISKEKKEEEVKKYQLEVLTVVHKSKFLSCHKII